MTTAWLFPGQGSQAVGMGKDVFDASPAARAVLAGADEALGERLTDLCFAGPIETLTLTANTQPAIVAVSAAILAALRERWPSLPPPACAAGHSLGEYAALHAAGAFQLADVVRVTRQRGRAMQEAVPAGVGAMAAVMSVDGDALAALCREVEAETGQVVSCANFNAPGQTVIAGHADAVARAGERAKERGGKVIPLNVSAPFHCALMAPVRQDLERALAAATLAAPRFPVLANVDAEPRGQAPDVARALVEQVDNPVQWVRTIERMRDLGVTHALEIGPGKVLAGLVKRIAKGVEVHNVSGVEAIEKIGKFLGLE
jgi:[acyl-carrier-protein] S-malonyltransferase